MKVLLDECIDSRLARHFSEFEVETVHDRGWSGITNGKLLALAQVDFDVFATVDRKSGLSAKHSEVFPGGHPCSFR